MRYWIFLIITLLLFALYGFEITKAEVIGSQTFTTTADFDSGDKGLVNISGSWSWKTSQPEAIDSGSGTEYNGSLYIFGGRKTGGAIQNKTFRYDPSTNTWTNLSDMTVALSATVAVTWNDRLYVFPGNNGTGNPGTVQYYNVTAANWTIAPGTDPISHDAPMATVYNESIYLSDGSLNIYKYNTSTGAFTDLGCAISSGASGSNGIIGDYWYFIGGVAFDTKVRRFNLLTNTCDNNYDTTPFSGRGEGSWSNIIIGGKIYMINGFKTPPNAFYRDVWEYEPVSKTWQQMVSASIPRASYAEGTINGINYVVGGLTDQSGFVAFKEVEAFDPTGTSNDGRYQVETSNNSRSVANNSFQLATGLSDSFYLNNHFGDPVFWEQVWDMTDGGCAFNISIRNASVIPVTNSSAGPPCAMTTKYTFSGDFDVRSNTSSWGSSAGVSAFQILNLKVPLWNENNTVDGGIIAFVSGGTSIEAYTVTNGVLTQCGSTVSSIPNWRYVRISASGTNWTFYHSPNSSTWTQIGSCTNSNSGPWYYNVATKPGITGISYVAMDDFYLASGTPSNGSYRTSGNWTSPILSSNFSSYRISSIAIGCSNVSTNANISRVEILDSGSTVETFDNDITSCSTISLTPSTTVTGNNRQIRITLSGNGSTSPQINDVTVHFSTADIATTTQGLPNTSTTRCVNVNKTINEVCIDTLFKHGARINFESIIYSDLETITISPPTGIVYKYFEINKVGIDNVFIDKATIRFSVNKSWLTENNIDKSNIFLQKYVGSSLTGSFLRIINSLFRITGFASLQIGPWLKNDASILSETDTVVNYESEFEDLSTFAITGETLESTILPQELDYARIAVTILLITLVFISWKAIRKTKRRHI